MSTSPSIERYRLLPLQVQIVGLVLCWTLTIIAIGVPHWGARVAGVFTGCLAIAFLFFPETQIDLERGVIMEKGRFLGLWTAWERRRTKEEFSGIRCYSSNDGGADEMPAEWMVELQPRSGRTIYIRQFTMPSGSRDCPEAREFARELSRLTGLDVIEDNV